MTGPVLRRPRFPALPPVPPADRPYKMGLNESPFPPPQAVLDAITAACALGHRYPDAANGTLTSALSSTVDTPRDTIAVGPGLVAVCRALVALTAGPGDEVVFGWPSFDDYVIDTILQGARPVSVPLTDHRLDLDAMADRLTDRTRLIMLCSPNNPTGSTLSRAEVEAFLDRVPAHVVVAFDHAYGEFVTDPEAVDGLDLRHDRPNVCVLRTFSKAYALAGLRVAYAVSTPRLAAGLREFLAPFGVSRIAEAAASAALAHEEIFAARVAAIVDERDRLTDGLRAAGWPVRDSQANFLWLPIGPAAATVAARLDDAGVSVRVYPGDGLRITVAGPAETANLLAALPQLAGAHG